MSESPTTTHWLLVRASVHNVGPKILGSYGCRADANDAKRRLGGSLLELEFWEANTPGFDEGISFAGEWLLPDELS